MNQTFNTLFESLKSSGFSAPCASDMAGYLISCLARPEVPGTIAELNKDIDDVIKALQQLKSTQVTS